MKVYSLIISDRRWSKKWLRPALLAAVLAASSLMSACLRSLPSETGPLPTLVATLALPVSASETPHPSATLTLELFPTDTETAPAPADSPTWTITPWVNDTPTSGPSPTPTRTSTVTRIPTLTRAPTRTPTITLTPTITFTPTPPPPSLYLLRPGLFSKVISPIQIEMYGVTGAQGKLTIELVGEDGRVISRQMLRQGSDEGKRFWMVPVLPFEIDAVAETARLQLSNQDAFGRTIALSSVDLILLSVGRNEINPPAVDQESYLIRRPEEDEVVSGGVLVLEALARPVNGSPLLVELVDENGIVMTVKQVVVAPPGGQLSHTPFTVEIPYKVSGPTPVRLVIRQEGSRIPGTVALVSQLIVLAP